jgi:hypothetical protein
MGLRRQSSQRYVGVDWWPVVIEVVGGLFAPHCGAPSALSSATTTTTTTTMMITLAMVTLAGVASQMPPGMGGGMPPGMGGGKCAAAAGDPRSLGRAVAAHSRVVPRAGLPQVCRAAWEACHRAWAAWAAGCHRGWEVVSAQQPQRAQAIRAPSAAQ